MKTKLFFFWALSQMFTSGQSVFIPQPSADRWMYPYNSSPGSRPVASTFSALPSLGGVSDRFGQMLMRFHTATAGIPAGLGAANYRISKVVLRATTFSEQSFRYDPTPDPWQSYAVATMADADVGRPVELFGLGFRNGFTALTFQETSPYGGSAPGGQNAFALGFTPAGQARDVSDNVTQKFDPLPWAVGTCAGHAPGAWVNADTTMEFTVNLHVPGVRQYIAQALQDGVLWLSLSSLHPAIQQGGEYADFHTKESPLHDLDGNAAPSLEIEYEIVLPQPTLTRNPLTGVVTLQWPALPGFTYQLQKSTTLLSQSWQTIHTVTSVSTAPQQWQGVSHENKAFFRIIRTRP